MNEDIKTTIREGFAHCAEGNVPTDFDLSAVVDEDILSVESIVAAMLSDKYNLSAEELAAFEELLNAPDVDPIKRHELLQRLWNIAVCLIDYQWENAALAVPQNSCGSISYGKGENPSDTPDMVESTDHTLTHNHNEAADEAPGQKGSP